MKELGTRLISRVNNILYGYTYVVNLCLLPDYLWTDYDMFVDFASHFGILDDIRKYAKLLDMEDRIKKYWTFKKDTEKDKNGAMAIGFIDASENIDGAECYQIYRAIYYMLNNKIKDVEGIDHSVREYYYQLGIGIELSKEDHFELLELSKSIYKCREMIECEKLLSIPEIVEYYDSIASRSYDIIFDRVKIYFDKVGLDSEEIKSYIFSRYLSEKCNENENLIDNEEEEC